MQRPVRQPRHLLLLLASAALVAAVLPATLQAATARSIRLEAGPQRGFTFATSGAVVSSKLVTYSSPVTVQSSDRVWVPTHGPYFRISSGSLAGYLVAESMLAYAPGRITTRSYSPAVAFAIPVGRHLGYQFDTSWRITSTKVASVATATSALISSRAVIHGRPFARVVSGTWAGFWLPMTTSTTLRSQRLTCASPGHISAGTQQIFTILPGALNQVALTFDMGGRIEPGLNIVNRLILDRVCTTFFPTGAMTATTEGQAILRLIGAHPELFELGNHTMHHCDLRDGGGGSPTTAPCPTTAPSRDFIIKELTDAATILRSASGMNPVPYWRVPYGAYNSAVLAAGSAAGYTKSFMWDVDTIDWRPVADGGPTAAQIAAKVATRAVNGTDVLMHLGGWNTYNALPSMVQRLRSRGLQPTTISDILR
jgi:peptidoglycan/xylan/chitin deacetylase (PgdA/CDA1 family)